MGIPPPPNGMIEKQHFFKKKLQTSYFLFGGMKEL